MKSSTTKMDCSFLNSLSRGKAKPPNPMPPAHSIPVVFFAFTDYLRSGHSSKSIGHLLEFHYFEQSMEPEETTACPVPRWTLIKQQLNNLPPAQFLAQVAARPDAILIDVRTPEEFDDFHLPNARLFNYLSAEHWDELEPLDREVTYFVYCRSGRRSLRTCILMQNGGFTDVYNLDGGLNTMHAQNLLHL